jgi:hypothetical protein
LHRNEPRIQEQESLFCLCLRQSGLWILDVARPVGSALKDDGGGRAKSRSNRREEATLRTGHVPLCTLPALGGLTTIAPQFIPPMTVKGESAFLWKET